jgi:hypothetical protein
VNRQLPDIARAAQRVRASIEDSVGRFARRHRYSVGADLRNAAREVARCTFLAWRDRNRQFIRVRELSTAVDNLKLEMMLAKDVSAFRSDAEFEAVARLVSDLGRQVGGWLKALHNKGQNAQGGTGSPAQRASILSSHAASHQEAAP